MKRPGLNYDLRPSLDCVDLVKHFESLHDGDLTTIGLQPKLCPTGYWTEGYGHVIIGPDKKPLTWKTPYKSALAHSTIKTESDALRVLAEDLAIRSATVKRFVTVRLTQCQFDALVSFQYNVGALGTSTLLTELNRGKWNLAAQNFNRWVWGTDPATGQKVELAGLKRRRKAERALFEGLDFQRYLTTK